MNPYYVQMMAGPVGRFGAYLMKRSFDTGMDTGIGILEGHSRSQKLKDLSAPLNSLTAHEREAVIAVVRESLIAALHGLLHGLSHDEAHIRLRGSPPHRRLHPDRSGEHPGWLRAPSGGKRS